MDFNIPGLVSVIIPVYNGARYLSAAIESVLLQEYPSVEIILIDDGSSDETATVARSFGPTVQYSYQSNQGPATARNQGVALAKGEFLAFLDADDWWHPQKVDRQVMLLTQQPTVDYVLTHMKVLQEANVAWPAALNQTHYQNEPPCFLPSALLVRRSAFAEIGPFDERYRYSDDADWFLRAKDASIPFAMLPEPLVYKRIHSTNLSSMPAMTQETMRAFHASIQRQRSRVSVEQRKRIGAER